MHANVFILIDLTFISSEKVELRPVLFRVGFFGGEIMWGWQRDDMHVVVCDQLFRFICGVLVAIAAETGLVNDQVGDVLGMVDRSW